MSSNITPSSIPEWSCWSSTANPKLWSSFNKTWNDSGIPGRSISSPLTIASYVFILPTTSSDFTVNISCKLYAALYASKAQTSISPNRWPPKCTLPPNGCWVIKEYGPVDLAWTLSSTKWVNFIIYILPTVIGWSNISPVNPSYKILLPKIGAERCSSLSNLKASFLRSSTFHPLRSLPSTWSNQAIKQVFVADWGIFFTITLL